MILARSRVSRNDLRSRILAVPPEIRERVAPGNDTLDVRLPGATAATALSYNSDRNFVSGVTDAFRAAGLFRTVGATIEVREGDALWSLDPETQTLSVELTGDGPWLKLRVAAPSGAVEIVEQPQRRFPDLSELATRYRQHPRIQRGVHHNARLFKRIIGGMQLALRNEIDFDPRAAFWYRPERRVLVSYLAKHWRMCYAPAAALRSYALQLFAHFDSARAAGQVPWEGVDYEAMGGWPMICDALIAHAGRLPELPEFAALKQVWVSVKAKSAAKELTAFLLETRDQADWPSTHEPSQASRLPWLPYLGTETLDELVRKQTFFFGYHALLMSTNAATHGGALNFAPVAQNTRTSDILAIVRRWVAGEYPDQTGFMTLGRDDEEGQPRDRSDYNTVIELFGFVNLHRAPYYNNVTADVLAAEFGGDKYAAYDLTRRVGERTRQFLDRNPDAVAQLAALTDELVGLPPSEPNVLFEGVRSSRAARRANQDPAELIDARLVVDSDTLAKEHVRSLSPRERAACALHLLMDAAIYFQGTDEVPGSVTVPPEVEPQPTSAAPSERRALPPGLVAAGQRALAYLRAGLHVLFAGAPGTGKTTLAQFVGHSWNIGASDLVTELPLAACPVTTVGNSAWSPFHTIGGLRPRADGGFEAHPGIFIDSARCSDAAWFLRPECLVLDEMNRADLDRCIGELYPLLSASVQTVFPAGIPGVNAIHADARFRVIATVNDATLDDIVFPISEGLARRFQRIELPGACAADVEAYLALDADAVAPERRDAAVEAVNQFFSLADEHNLLRNIDEEDRLPFGAGYFALLRAWAHGKLDMPLAFGELSAVGQAKDLIVASLATAARVKAFDGVLAALQGDD